MAGPIDPRLVRRGRATRAFLAALVLVGLVQAVAIVAQARVVSDAISSVFATHATASLPGWPLLLVAIAIARGMLTWLGASLAHRAAAAVKHGLRHDLARARLRRPLDASTSSSSLVAVSTQGLDALDGYYAKYLPQLVLSVLVPLAVVAVVATQDVASAVVIGVTLPLVPVFMALIGWTTEAQVRRRWKVQTRLANHFADLVTGLPTLQAFGRARAQGEGLRATEQRHRTETMRTLRVTFLSSFALELLSTLSVALVAVQVGFRVVFDHMDLRRALFVLVLAPEAYLPLRQVGAHYHDAADGMAAADQALGIIEAADAPPAVAAHPPAGAAPGPGITVDRVTLTWPGAPSPVLDDVCLHVAPGEVVAVRGTSGGGKSTLLGVLLGFLRPDAGRVLLDGRDVAGDLDRWRRQVAWVAQQPAMPLPTIRENVQMGASVALDDAALRACLDDAGGRSLSLDRPVGDDARGLSAGERRRVAIARALVRLRHGGGHWLVMDEPTAGLDADAEAAVLSAVRASGAGALVVTHRRAVLAAADRVVTIGGGA